MDFTFFTDIKQCVKRACRFHRRRRETGNDHRPTETSSGRGPASARGHSCSSAPNLSRLCLDNPDRRQAKPGPDSREVAKDCSPG
jgi:hypothetical protein